MYPVVKQSNPGVPPVLVYCVFTGISLRGTLTFLYELRKDPEPFHVYVVCSLFIPVHYVAAFRADIGTVFQTEFPVYVTTYNG